MAKKKPALKPVWLTNAVIVTQNRKREVFRGSVLIVGDKIANVKKGQPAPTRGTQVQDVKGLTLIPGFVQAHVHLCQTLMRNQADDVELLDWLRKKIWPYEGALTHKRTSLSAWTGIHELLTSGTTCLLDMGTVRHTEAIFEAVKKSGIRANVGKCLMDNPKTCPPSLREPTAKALTEAEALFKKWNGAANDRIRASFAPRFVISCTEELLQGVGALSRKYDAIIHTHASENKKEVAFVKTLTGRNNIEYLNRLKLTSERLVLAHCIWLNDREMKTLHATKSNVTHCPSSNLKLASGIARVPDMLKRGINVALGADGAPCNNNLNMFQEMRLAALIHKPGHGPQTLRAQEALDMATLNGAKALHWDDTIGSLEVGKAADIAAIDLNTPVNRAAAITPEAIASALVYSTQPAHVSFTMVAGRVVAKNGRLVQSPPFKL